MSNIDPDIFLKKVKESIDLIQFSEQLNETQIQPFASVGFTESKKEAEEIIQRQDVKKAICFSLTKATDDAFEIANTMTPILIGAILAETVVMPLNPILFGWIAVLIARAGLASFCENYKIKE